jgi:hypothetical protein
VSNTTNTPTPAPVWALALADWRGGRGDDETRLSLHESREAAVAAARAWLAENTEPEDEDEDGNAPEFDFDDAGSACWAEVRASVCPLSVGGRPAWVL